MDNSLLNIIKNWMEKDGCELSIRRKNTTDKVVVKIVQHLPGGSSENEQVRRKRHCQVINTYRNGKKSGMKIITNLEIDISAISNVALGDHGEHPVERHSTDNNASDDTS